MVQNDHSKTTYVCNWMSEEGYSLTVSNSSIFTNSHRASNMGQVFSDMEWSTFVKSSVTA